MLYDPERDLYRSQPGPIMAEILGPIDEREFGRLEALHEIGSGLLSLHRGNELLRQLGEEDTSGFLIPDVFARFPNLPFSLDSGDKYAINDRSSSVHISREEGADDPEVLTPVLWSLIIGDMVLEERLLQGNFTQLLEAIDPVLADYDPTLFSVHVELDLGKLVAERQLNAVFLSAEQTSYEEE